MMSKKRKKFLVFNEPDSQAPFLLRAEFHKALVKEGIIEQIWVDDDFIEVKETSEKAKLKRIKIIKLNDSDRQSQVEIIWRVNLEKEIPGISTGSKTPEVALLVLQKFLERNYKLNIILIELKSSLQNRELVNIKEKLRCAMNRLYMLISLNNHGNPSQGYNWATIHVKFIGAIFYSRNNIQASKITEPEAIEIYDILQKTPPSGQLRWSSLLNDNDPIEIKFFDQQTIALKYLI